MASPTGPKISRETDIGYARILFQLATLLALLPPYDFRAYKFKNTIWYKIYSIVILVTFSAAFVYSLKGKINEVYPTMKTTIMVVNVLASVSYYVLNITSVMSKTFFNFHNLNNMVKNLVFIDKKLYVYNLRLKTTNRLFLIEITLQHIMIFSLFAYDFFVWSCIISYTAHKYLLFEILQKYHTHILVCLMYNLILCIKNRYSTLNELLSEVVLKRKIVRFTDNIRTHINSLNFKEVAMLLTKTNEMVDLFNDIYGWVMLFLNINIIASFLVALDFIIEFSSSDDSFSDEYDLEFIVLMLLWTLLALCLGVALASTCDATIREAQKTPIITYKLLQTLPLESSDPLERDLREDLLLLSEQTSLRTPSFSAAGFFTVDYTMLFTLLGSVTSYLIVLIQFN